MNQYSSKNASFLFPFQFDSEALEFDLKTCESYDFLKNYVPANYDGKDYILPLRSIEGRIDFPAAVPFNGELFKDTEALKDCSYFREVIDTFLCEKDAIRLMNLPAGRSVNTHTDLKCGYEEGVFRVHVPIITNEKVCFTLDNHDLYMKPGEAWYTNVNLPHSVANEGQTNRVHLVIDCKRNEWSDKLFESLGYDFDLENKEENIMSSETRLRVIEELRLQGTKSALNLLEQLLKEGEHL